MIQPSKTDLEAIFELVYVHTHASFGRLAKMKVEKFIKNVLSQNWCGTMCVVTHRESIAQYIHIPYMALTLALAQAVQVNEGNACYTITCAVETIFVPASCNTAHMAKMTLKRI